MGGRGTVSRFLFFLFPPTLGLEGDFNLRSGNQCSTLFLCYVKQVGDKYSLVIKMSFISHNTCSFYHRQIPTLRRWGNSY